MKQHETIFIEPPPCCIICTYDKQGCSSLFNERLDYVSWALIKSLTTTLTGITSFSHSPTSIWFLS